MDQHLLQMHRAQQLQVEEEVVEVGAIELIMIH